MDDEVTTSQELWQEYNRLCDLAERASENDPDANATWAPILEHARNEAVFVERLEMQEHCMLTGTVYNYPWISSDMADNLIERGG